MTLQRLTPFVAAILLGCGGPTSSDPFLTKGSGDFAYTAYTASGARVLVGTMHLENDVMVPLNGAPPAPFGGTWTIDWAPGADHTILVGPQVGTGRIDGSTSDQGLRAGLNPANVDNNVYLEGLVRGESVSGDWTYSTLRGPDGHGTFTLVPIP